MNDRARRFLPLVAGLLLGAALLSRFLLSAPEAPAPREAVVSPVSPEARPSPVSPSPAPPASTPVKPAPGASEQTVAAEGASGGTEVPIGPDDVVPLPEVANPLPQHNDPIEPELPQTAAWRHGKLVRLTELLGRDVERLVQELQAARSRGDTAEARRLEVQIDRHRARLGSLREESTALAEQARQEAQGP